MSYSITYVCARAGVWSTRPSPAPSWAHGAEIVRYAGDEAAGMTNWLSGCKWRQSERVREKQTNGNNILLYVFLFFSRQIQTTWGLPLSYTDCVWFKLDLIRTSSANCHNTFVIVITRRPQMTHGQAEAAQLLLAVWGFGFGFSVTTGGESPL